jgi:mersacidin/lichenicidin family type 2 lantibiotic
MKTRASETTLPASPAQTSSSNELSDDQLEAVTGGGKKKDEQQEYLVIKLTDVLISGVTP